MKPGAKAGCRLLAVTLALFALGTTGAAARLHDGDPGNGEQVFRMCAGCHSLMPGVNRVGLIAYLTKAARPLD